MSCRPWLLFFLLLLCWCGHSNAQNWSGILDPTRAMDWSQAGVTGGIRSNRTQCGATIAAYNGTAAAINNAIASCGAEQFVLLGAGTFNLTTGIDFANHSNVTLRGNGPDSTFLIFTGHAGCGGFFGVICVENASQAYSGNVLGHVANWTAGYAAGTTSITLDFKDSFLSAGNILILDMCNTGYSGAPCAGSSNNNNQLFLCDDAPGAGNTAPPSCSTEGGEGITRPERGEGQIVKIQSASGNTVTITPAVVLPNVASGLTPQAWWTGGTITGVGVESLSLDASNSGSTSNITFFDAADSWVQNVRSVKSNRSHVLLIDTAHITIRDSYFYGTANAASQSYGIETDVASDSLIENNIFHHVTSPMPQGKLATGNVYGYNFAINDFYTVTPQWMQGSQYHHAEGLLYNLFEGIDGAGFQADIIHGTGAFGTGFRNRWHGWESCGDTPGCSGSKTQLTEAINIAGYVRYYNFVGNVLGTSGYHTGYECYATSGTSSCNQYNAGNLAVYELGFTAWNGECVNCGGAGTIPNDLMVRSTLMRWGNYDTANASNQFNASEVPSGISPYGNAVPANQNLPASFYLSATPTWWGNVPWPAIGPDVTGGNLSGVGGHANLIPAGNCFLNVMGGPADGSGNVLTFNASTCYGNAPPPPDPPTGLNAVVQ